MSLLPLWPLGLVILATLLLLISPLSAVRGIVIATILALTGSLILLWLGLWHVPDMLDWWFYGVVTTLSVWGLWYSLPYIALESSQHHWSSRMQRSYWVLLLGFIASLIGIALIPNYLLLWVLVEAATLTSVFLTGIPGQTRSTEAAWKYLTVTEVGGFVALVGTGLILSGTGRAFNVFSYHPEVVAVSLPSSNAVLFGALMALIGYATKAGLSPFHTWLPDAHSEAPAPVSALLSGLKLSGALIVAYRLLLLTSPRIAATDIRFGWILLGLLSLVISAAFMAYQTDLKRLWAYSSIEHMGLISLGFGFGGIALIGAILHIWTHAVTKTLLFHNAGTVRLLYRTSQIETGAKNLLERTPWTGSLLVLGATAITGLPPFAPFWSEWLILTGGFQHSFSRLPAIIAALALIAVFSGIAWRLPRWLWLPGPTGLPLPLHQRIREPWSLITPTAALGVLVISGGLLIPWIFAAPWHHLMVQLAGSPMTQP